VDEADEGAGGEVSQAESLRERMAALEPAPPPISSPEEVAASDAKRAAMSGALLDEAGAAMVPVPTAAEASAVPSGQRRGPRVRRVFRPERPELAPGEVPPAGPRTFTRVQMTAYISGFRNGIEWPPVGGTVDLPAHEAEDLVRARRAVVVVEGIEPKFELDATAEGWRGGVYREWPDLDGVPNPHAARAQAVLDDPPTADLVDARAEVAVLRVELEGVPAAFATAQARSDYSTMTSIKARERVLPIELGLAEVRLAEAELKAVAHEFDQVAAVRRELVAEWGAELERFEVVRRALALFDGPIGALDGAAESCRARAAGLRAAIGVAQHRLSGADFAAFAEAQSARNVRPPDDVAHLQGARRRGRAGA
jgi:hypothetical protein